MGDEIEVTASFGANPLWTRHFPLGDLTLGEGGRCVIPGMPLRVVDGRSLDRHRRIEIEESLVRVAVSLVAVEKLERAPLASRIDAMKVASLVFSALAHVGLLAALAYLLPSTLADSREISRDQVLVMRTYLASAAEHELSAPAPVVHGPECRLLPLAGGGDGKRPNGERRAALAAISRRGALPSAEHAGSAVADASRFGAIGLFESSTCDAAASAEPNAWAKLVEPPSGISSFDDGPNVPSDSGGGGLGGGGSGGSIGLARTLSLGDPLAVPLVPCYRRSIAAHVVEHESLVHHPRHVAVQGALDDAAVRVAFRARDAELARCYRDGLANDPALAGTVSVELLVARDGSVAAARDGASDLPDASVRACVLRVSAGLAFSPPSRGTARVVYAIAFSPP